MKVPIRIYERANSNVGVVEFVSVIHRMVYQRSNGTWFTKDSRGRRVTLQGAPFSLHNDHVDGVWW